VPAEIIVVADGDTDGSWQQAKQFGVGVLRFPSPGGPARARNFGASQAKGEILFFVDADVMIPPDAMSQVAAGFKREPALAAFWGSLRVLVLRIPKANPYHLSPYHRARAMRLRTEDGCITDVVDIRQAIAIEIEYEVLKPGHVSVPCIGLATEEGLAAFVSHDHDPAWRRRARPVGRFSCTVHIPGNFSSEGQVCCRGGSYH